MLITPAEFVKNWNDSTLREQQGAQLHFQQLVELVGLNSASYFGTTGDKAVFEQQVEKTGGGAGRADVSYQGRFAWEYKGKLKDLDSAYAQVLSYRSNLGNPPLLIVCDFLEYRIYPQWPNLSGQPIKIFNQDLLQEDKRDLLRWALTDPDKIRHVLEKQRLDSEKLTEILANKFAHLSDLMRQHPLGKTPKWGSMQIARFLTKLVFSLFVEDVGLIPSLKGTPIFRYITDGARQAPEGFVQALTLLFQVMNGEIPTFIMTHIPYFNGGIFAESAEGAGDNLEVLDITEIPGALDILSEAADADWRSVNPTIFGTLFEGALDTSKRAQLGAHYTSEADIRLVIDPVLMSPLLSAWEVVQTEAAPLMQLFLDPAAAPKARKTAETRLTELREGMYTQLESTTVLDPACGSGNFLYVALKALKDLERKIRDAFRPLDPDGFRDVVTPRQLFGIEKDPFAAKLAHVVMWIGYLQWRYEDEGVLHWHEPRKQPHPRALPNPIIQDKLKPTDPDRVTNDDAILRYDADGKPYEPAWPPAKIIIGNPPFLGGYKQRSELGGKYLDDLFKLYKDRIPAGVDLVCYWFEKARSYIESGQINRAGLISTNSIRGGANRIVLDRIKQTGDIFMAHSDNEWVLSGAAVRISIIGFDKGHEKTHVLDGVITSDISPDLKGDLDITQAKNMNHSTGLIIRGIETGGPFEISNIEAKRLLQNPLYKSVLTPIVNGNDLTDKNRKEWVIDFYNFQSPDDQRFSELFNILRERWQQEQKKKRPPQMREKWWLFRRSGEELRTAIKGLDRFIATPRVSKHRLFVWVEKPTIVDSAIFAIARDDDYFFGVLHSYLHELWSLRLGTWLGKGNDPRYTPTTTFETFPFPYPPGQEPVEKIEMISAAAATLHAEREAWLNPADLIKLGADEKALKDRTLTNLYNAVSAHRAGDGRSGKIPEVARKFAPRMAELHDILDAAVLSAYGWDDLIPTLRTPSGEEEILRRLLAENQRRANLTP